MRVETIEKPVERVIERIRVQTKQVPVGPAEAAKIVLDSPRACRAVLESLAAHAEAGKLAGNAHAPTLRAAETLLTALRRRRLIDG